MTGVPSEHGMVLKFVGSKDGSARTGSTETYRSPADLARALCDAGYEQASVFRADRIAGGVVVRDGGQGRAWWGEGETAAG